MLAVNSNIARRNGLVASGSNPSNLSKEEISGEGIAARHAPMSQDGATHLDLIQCSNR